MIILDKPFVSEFLKATIRKYAYPVVKTTGVKQFGFNDEPYLLDEDRAIATAQATDNLTIYTNSENAIGWIARHLTFTDLPQKIALFKNKTTFRTLLKPLYPNFFFREVQLGHLRNLPLESIPMPCIIKPAVGFFSMGVHKVSNPREWEPAVDRIFSEIDTMQEQYPVEVLNTTAFIIEQCIAGEEFAIDAYFNAAGEPVILNILQHVFASDNDVSDRVYLSSKKIIENNIDEFTVFLKKIGSLSGVKNFPVHVEVRREENASLLPIEINPMRFGGWCTTPDMTYSAYGFNPYEYYFSQKKPDWVEILTGKAGKLYSVIVLDNSTGLDEQHIAGFNYPRLLSTFENPLKLRKIDHTEYPVFGFLFAETQEENFAELEQILTSDLREFIITK